MIEPCWYHLKRQTTRVWTPAHHTDMVRKWEEEWQQLDQKRIQQ